MPIEADVISPNKIAIVTGGSRGIGRNTVVSLAKCGVNSIFTYNSNQAEAERVIGLVAQAGQKAIALQLDTGNVGAFETFVRLCAELRPDAVFVDINLPGKDGVSLATQLACSTVMAKPIEPRPPALQTAVARSTVPKPAKGDNRIGCSICKTSISRRSAHISSSSKNYLVAQMQPVPIFNSLLATCPKPRSFRN